MKKYRVLINGNLIETTQYFDVINPSTEEIVGKAPLVNKEIVDNCVKNANNAFLIWNNTHLNYKIACLNKLKDILQRNQNIFADLLVREQGKTLKDANDEIEECFQLIENYIKLDLDSVFDKYTGTGTHEVKTIRVPLGVCLLITPWNYPVFTAIQKICPAIMLGNTIILKPSPFTPLTSLLLGELIVDIFPKGVVNILTGLDMGDFMLGSYLTSHPNISKISFTGSTNTGRKIMQTAALDFKRITLEMGGNDAAIILSDIDSNPDFFQKMVKDVFASAFTNTGALCCAIKRVYVDESIFKKFVKEIVKIAQNTVIGDGFDEKSDYGPINNKMQFERGIELIQDAVNNNAKIECGGKNINKKKCILYSIYSNKTCSLRENILLKHISEENIEGCEAQQFMAQMAYESDRFKAMEEYASGEQYENRKDLGNNQPGDGIKYKGRGYIQLTGRDNYQRFGKMIGVNLTELPERASEPNIAAKIAICFWKKRVKPKVSDFNNTELVTKIINGGNRGIIDRKNIFHSYQKSSKYINNVGYFYQPTIITNVNDDTRIVKEEQFFPALPIMSYKTEEEAISRANNTKYGLGGSVWSNNTEKACQMAKKLRAGTCWVNTHADLSGGEFGGRVGFSGFGRELGKADLYSFTESQTLMFPRK